MDSFLSELLGECRMEYVVLNDRMGVVKISNDAAKFADPPESLRVGANICDAFPELIGAENKLRVIARTKLGEWRVRNISRTYSAPHFMLDLSVIPAPPHPADRLVLLLEDVTERAALEQRLVQHSNEARLLLNTVDATKNYYERILESMGDALFVTSSDGIVKTVNSATMLLLGMNKAELIGNHLAKFLNDDGLLFSEQPNSILETVAFTNDRTEIPVSVSSAAVGGEEGFVVFLVHDLRPQRETEAEIRKLKTENFYLHEEIESAHNFREIIGKSPPIKSVFRQIEQVATTDSTVLVTGETGTGKELIAHAIHNLSARKDAILVKVNCGALPSTLVESELFGHEKGAFTGASARRMGRFEHADGGTILLDEIGELPLETQVKLLRVLQEREFERVGGSEAVRADVRIIASTNRNLEESVSNGTFRSDLFFRINVFPIIIPPLRDRREDIPLLVQHFVKKYAARMKKNIMSVHSQGMEELVRYSWPGNVRELAAVIERAIILCEGETLSYFNLLPSPVRASTRPKPLSLEESERQHILATLREVGGVIEGPSGAAMRLEINPSTLRSRMKKLGIRRSGDFV